MTAPDQIGAQSNAAPISMQVYGVGWPEVVEGDDLADLLLRTADLRDGDIVVVTSKVVSKSEGRTRRGDRDEHIAAETVRVVARRGGSAIVQTRHGLVLAAAGVDASNTPLGTVVLLPVDPDASARRLRERLYSLRGVNVAVVVSDTLGRAWRTGQTDVAIGCAGLEPIIDLSHTHDRYGNELRVTAPAIADEVTGAADLVTGKLTDKPVAVVRGLSALVLDPADHGVGAVALVRESSLDLFALGVREAASAVAVRDDEALRHVPDLATDENVPWNRLASPHSDVTLSIEPGPAATPGRSWLVTVAVATDAQPDAYVAAGALVERARTLAAAYGIAIHDEVRQGAPTHPGVIAVLRGTTPRAP